jgi:hypothetical protein
MRKREQLLWDSFRRNMPPELDLQRVENIATDGMPDVYVGLSGKWVELKAPPERKRSTTPLLGREGLRTSQVNWHLKHSSMNAPESFILIRTTSGELLLLSGEIAPIINDMTLNGLERASMIGGAAVGAASWRAIAEVLK